LKEPEKTLREKGGEQITRDLKKGTKITATGGEEGDLAYSWGEKEGNQREHEDKSNVREQKASKKNGGGKAN